MHSSFATTAVDQDDSSSVLNALADNFHSVLALVTGVLAAFWLVCAVITIAGYLTGVVVVFGVRALVGVCARYVRRRHDPDDAQHGTADTDGVHSNVVNFDHHRHRRQHQCSDDLPPDDTFPPCPEDDPA